MNKNMITLFRGALKFRKSTFSPKSRTCVAVARHKNHVYVTDTKNVEAPILCFSEDEWQAFLSGVKTGEFDL
jgi:hypothetical protein